jgi:exosortase/archaeosortase family protein
MMKPISAEDNLGAALVDSKARNKTIGIILLLVLVLVSIFNSIAHTGFVITDSDPSSYVIVVMLMLLVMIIFSAKEDIGMKASVWNVALGFIITAVFIVALSLLRGYLSFAFYTLRVDALLFPLIFLSLIVTLFGVEGLRKLKWLVVYSAFASPTLMYWLIGLNGAFVNLNASIVYSALTALGLPLTKVGISMASSTVSPSISIASTCAALGIFIALFMFLLPVMYLYHGKRSKKLAWLLTAIVLLLLLNLARMVSISLIWVYSGMNSALSTYHAFAGEVLFYLTIIVMLLVAGKYGLWIDRLDAVNLRKRFAQPVPYLNVICAIAIGLIFFTFTLPYSGLATSSLASFNLKSNVNNTRLFNLQISQLSESRLTVAGTQFQDNSTIFTLYPNRSSGLNYSVYVVGASQQKPFPAGIFLNRTYTFKFAPIILRNGITMDSGYIIDNETNFTVNYFSLPLRINGSTITVGYEFFQLHNSTAPLCDPQTGRMNALQSQIYAIFTPNVAPHPEVICSAYAIANLG